MRSDMMQLDLITLQKKISRILGYNELKIKVYSIY